VAATEPLGCSLNGIQIVLGSAADCADGHFCLLPLIPRRGCRVSTIHIVRTPYNKSSTICKIFEGGASPPTSEVTGRPERSVGLSG
jgi:hypothetical protein